MRAVKSSLTLRLVYGSLNGEGEGAGEEKQKVQWEAKLCRKEFEFKVVKLSDKRRQFFLGKISTLSSMAELGMEWWAGGMGRALINQEISLRTLSTSQDLGQLPLSSLTKKV